MLGSDLFYFRFIYSFLILKGAPAPSFYLGTPMGGHFLDTESKGIQRHLNPFHVYNMYIYIYYIYMIIYVLTYPPSLSGFGLISK